MDPTTRFSSRVGAYVAHRPGYPPEMVARIAEVTGVQAPALVADIGSGTGISAHAFLDAGYAVAGVEPNDAMRNAAEPYLAGYHKFRSIKGTAEATTLAEDSVDLVVAAQAFHWFSPERSREEWRRILRGEEWVALIWNDRQTDSTPFLREYEVLLLEHGTDYTTVNHRNIDGDRISEFFAATPVRKLELGYTQHLDWHGLKGRLDSSSYIPDPGTAAYDRMIADLDRLWKKHNEKGFVDIIYTTLVYIGKLS